MLDRIWLILIFVLAGFVPQMHAARVASPLVGEPCAMVCCAGGCICSGCSCSIEDSPEHPDGPVPAVPTQPEREQKRTSEPGYGFGDLVLPEKLCVSMGWDARRAGPSEWAGVRRLESVFCVWRI